MAKLGKKKITISGVEQNIAISRDQNGIPCVEADNFGDLFFGLGWVHANDRLLNLELNRLVGKGRGAEHLSPKLVNLDISMRRYNLWGDSVAEAAKLSKKDRIFVNAYCAGINRRLEEGPLPFEFKLIGYRPEKWTTADTILGLKLIGLVDLTETQGWMEKCIIQMIQKGVGLPKLKELFPYLIDSPEPEHLNALMKVRLPNPLVPESIPWAIIPRMQCSNNWVVAGPKSITRRPLLCADPHLDTSRLPAIWQEIILRCGDFYYTGATVPGIPGLPLGRTNHLAWSPTYGNMDVIDYFIEEVKDGKYRRQKEYADFSIREEVINVKKGKPVTVRFFENDHGVLEEEPLDDGYYLCMAWSGARGCGSESIKAMFNLPNFTSVKEALPDFAQLDFGSFNWVAADDDGNIGYQMSGRCPVRKDGVSGLLAVPGWDESFSWRGYHDRHINPSCYNPPEGFIATANNDLNKLGKINVINLAMAPDRAGRIEDMLAARNDHSIESMQKMQYDIYSKQAEIFMNVIRPLLPDNEKGLLLEEWDLRYSSDSKAPSLFENIYRELTTLVFGELNLGRDVITYLLDETVLLHDYYCNFDRVLLKENSLWFGDKTRSELFSEAIRRAFGKEVSAYGEGRKIMLKHLLLGGLLPPFFGFDCGPVEFIGGRATISISQFFKAEGREATFSPTYRFITDLNEDRAYSVLAGGPSDRRFSPWYISGLAGWISGHYKTLEPGGPRLKEETPSPSP